MTERPPPGPSPDLHGYHLPQPRRRAADGRGQSHGTPLHPPPGAAGPRRPPPSRRSWWKSALLGLGFLLLTALTFIAAYVVGANPSELARAAIVDFVKARTGRELSVSGGVALRVFPAPGVVLKGVTLSAPPGMSGPPTARVAALDVALRAMPLLQRRVEVERLVLRDAEIDLRVDKSGRRSWDFAAAVQEHGLAPLRYAELGSSAAGSLNDAAPISPQARDFLRRATVSASTPALGGLSAVALEDVRLENGRLRYADERSPAPPRELSAIDATLSLKDFDGPLAAAGNFVLLGEKVEFDGHASKVADLFANRPVRLVLTLTASSAKAAFEGTLAQDNALQVDGSINASSSSARSLARWLGADPLPTSGFGPASLKAGISLRGATLALTDATFGLDGAEAKGQLAIDSGGTKPLLRGSLELSELDLNKYLGVGERSDATSSRATAAAPPRALVPASGPVEPAPPQSIDDLLRAPGPRVKGFVKREGWSEEPIAVSGLSRFDADLALTAARVLVGDIKTGRSRLAVAVAASQLKANIVDVALYDGHAHGLVTLDGAAGVPVLGLSIVADGVSAEPLLRDAAGFTRLSGTGKIVLAVAGSGASERAIVESLSGTASLNLANGAVAGYDVAAILRGLAQGKLTGLKSSPTEKTEFSEMSASFAIQNGVGDNQDLKIVSPLLRVAGAGRVLLGPRQVDYVVRPKLVAAAAGQAATAETPGLEVPIRISGSWDGPQITPDVGQAIGNVLKDPGKAASTVKEIGRQLGGKKGADLLKGLLGKN